LCDLRKGIEHGIASYTFAHSLAAAAHWTRMSPLGRFETMPDPGGSCVDRRGNHTRYRVLESTAAWRGGANGRWRSAKRFRRQIDQGRACLGLRARDEDAVVPSKVKPSPPSAGADRRGSYSLGQDWDFIRRVLITVVIGALAYFVWQTSRVLLLIFASVLLAVLLTGFAELIARRTPIPRRWTLTAATLIATVLLAGFLSLFGFQISAQIMQVVEKLPAAIDAAGIRLGISNAAEQLETAITSRSDPSFVFRAAGIGYTLFGGLTDLALVVVAAIYIAADPKLYRRGVAMLLPPSQHARIFDAMDVTGSALRLWFAGQLVAMLVVGVISGLAYWGLGLPSPVALGIISGLTNFIPFLGPILGAVPALVFALAIDVETVLWTAAVAIAIQQFEGNLITPLIQREAVSMPPALALFAIVISGLLFGLLGVFLAVPLAVALLVLVKKLWVRETLGEETVVPGEENAKAEGS
jgi:predicted PurR-regulated permease PerM